MPTFGQFWDQALKVRQPMLEDAAFERAVNGVTVPITRLGKAVGERRRYSDALLRYLIERADRHEAAGRDMASKRHLAPMSKDELDVNLYNRLTSLGAILEQKKLDDPEGAARQEAEDDRVLADFARRVRERSASADEDEEAWDEDGFGEN